MDTDGLPPQSRTLFSLLAGLSEAERDTSAFAVMAATGRSSEALLSALEQATESMPSLRSVVVVTYRPFVGTLRRLVTGRRPIRCGAMSVRRVRRTLSHQSWGDESVYALWPSGETPSIAVPLTSRGAVRWVHRAGILGGGGQRVWLRVLLRSRLATPLMARSYPAVAVVLRRRAEDLGE